MKNKPFLPVLLLTAVLSGCNGTWVMYDTDQKDHIYFADGKDEHGATIAAEQDVSKTHTASFSLIVEDDIDMTARVRVMGQPSDRDRAFSVTFTQAASGETFSTGTAEYPVVSGVEGEDFSVSDLVIPAGQTVGTMHITLHRTAKMLDAYVRVGVRLAENTDFVPVTEDKTTSQVTQSPEYVVYVNDGVPSCPGWWRYANNAKYPLGWSCYMGNFFPEKFRRMLTLFKETEQTAPTFYEDMVAAYGENLENATINFFRSKYPNAWAKYVFMPLYNYYKAYFAEHPDDPNYELIGTETVVINSFIGWGDPMDGTYGFFN